MSDFIEVIPMSKVMDPHNCIIAKMDSCLYKVANTGKMRVWEARVIAKDGKVYYLTRFGDKDGAVTEKDAVIKPTKTLSAQEKAISKLKSAVASKLDSGYCKTEQEAKDYKPTKPMLLHKWTDHGSKMEYPAFIQPKLDGVCAIYRDDPKDPRFESRENNRFPKLDSLAKELCDYMDGLSEVSRKRIHLHGEIYAHGRHVSEIVEALKGDNADVFSELRFYVFDYIPEHEEYDKFTYKDRLAIGSKFTGWSNLEKPFAPIQTLVAITEDDVDKHYDSFIKQGFEGAVISTPSGCYRYESRTYHKLKKKNLFSDEFEIIGAESEQIGDDDMIMFKLRTKDGVQFTARPAWTHERRKKAWKEATSYLGKFATVEYRSLTKYNTPFHGVLIEVRDYE